jgi:2-octaprenyl-6-methoxyphenol hydroxylase
VDRLVAEPEVLLNAIQSALGDLLGSCTAVTTPTVIPLIERWLDTPYRPGIAVFGNGAQTIHPVAGQGLNLALRGVSRVVEAIEDGSIADLDRCIQAGFHRWRQDRAQTRGASSMLEQAFAWRSPVRRLVSGSLVAILDHHVGAKRWIAEAGMGRYA